MAAWPLAGGGGGRGGSSRPSCAPAWATRSVPVRCWPPSPMTRYRPSYERVRRWRDPGHGCRAAANARVRWTAWRLSAQQIGQWLAVTTARRRVEAPSALALQQLRLKHTRVLAPDSGVITARPGTLGAVVAPGQELFRLFRQGRLEWRAGRGRRRARRAWWCRSRPPAVCGCRQAAHGGAHGGPANPQCPGLWICRRTRSAPGARAWRV
jgi:hypothetical protein